MPVHRRWGNRNRWILPSWLTAETAHDQTPQISGSSTSAAQMQHSETPASLLAHQFLTLQASAATLHHLLANVAEFAASHFACEAVPAEYLQHFQVSAPHSASCRSNGLLFPLSRTHRVYVFTWGQWVADYNKLRVHIEYFWRHAASALLFCRRHYTVALAVQFSTGNTRRISEPARVARLRSTDDSHSPVILRQQSSTARNAFSSDSKAAVQHGP